MVFQSLNGLGYLLNLSILVLPYLDYELLVYISEYQIRSVLNQLYLEKLGDLVHVIDWDHFLLLLLLIVLLHIKSIQIPSAAPIILRV